MRSLFQNSEFEEQFDNYGFFTVPLLSRDNIDELLKIFKDCNPSLSREGFHATMLSNEPSYRKKVDGLIKKEIEPLTSNILNDFSWLFSNFIVKEAMCRQVVGVHQDWNYVDESRFTSVNIWIPLQDTNLENGALWVLPGSHKLQTPQRYTPFAERPYDQFIPDIKSMSKMISSKAGEAVVYHPGLFHFSELNHTDKPRIAVAFVNIPSESESIHYFRSEDEPGMLEVIDASGDFFFEINPGERPSGFEVTGRVMLCNECFNKEDLYDLKSKVYH